MSFSTIRAPTRNGRPPSIYRYVNAWPRLLVVVLLDARIAIVMIFVTAGTTAAAAAAAGAVVAVGVVCEVVQELLLVVVMVMVRGPDPDNGCLLYTSPSPRDRG